MSKPQWVWEYDRVISSDAASCRQVLNDIIRQVEAEHWSQRDLFSINLALEEALVNAIQHGNCLDVAKHVHVTCAMSHKRIHIEIADEGKGFNPGNLPDPTCAERLHWPAGRGIMLMKAFMSRVEYNAAGNHVVLEKERGRLEKEV